MDQDSDKVYLTQELSAKRKALRLAIQFLIELSQTHPNMRPKIQAKLNEINEAQCWND